MSQFLQNLPGAQKVSQLLFTVVRNYPEWKMVQRKCEYISKIYFYFWNQEQRGGNSLIKIQRILLGSLYIVIEVYLPLNKSNFLAWMINSDFEIWNNLHSVNQLVGYEWVNCYFLYNHRNILVIYFIYSF